MKFLLFLFFVLIFFGCDGFKKQAQPQTKWVKIGNHFIVRKYYGNNLISKEVLDLDSVPDGFKTTFYNDGIIKNVSCFTRDQKAPQCSFYYDTFGVFDSFTGMPIMDVEHDDSNNMIFTLMNPPNIYYFLGFVDYYNGKSFCTERYQPIKFRSFSTVKFSKKHLNNLHHEYYFDYVVYDSIHKRTIQQYEVMASSKK